jgi:hypothetical protein
MDKAGNQHAFVMRSNSSFILFLVALFIISSVSIALSQTDPYQSIMGVKFKDGSIVMGSVIQMNVDTITIRTDDGQTVVRKFSDVDKFLKSYDEVEALNESKEILYSSLEFGFMYSYYDYKETLPPPGKSTESGWLPGIYLSYDRKKSSEIYVKLYGNITGGDLNFNGTTFAGSPASFDHSQFFFKFEGDVGYTVPISEKLLLIPYTGYGYRYWRRGETEAIAGGTFIKEVYTWSYVPVGIKVDYAIDDKWNIGGNAAIHFMFGGKMTSYFSEVNSALPDLEFDLGNKPGYYFEIPVSYEFDKNWSITGTLWYEYSEIGKSNVVSGLYEPDSSTNQYGINLGVAYLF